MMKTCTIINGKNKSKPAIENIQASAARFGSQLMTTSETHSAENLARMAIACDATRLVVAGGDGTCNQVINGLAPEFPSITLGIIPLGTGNDLARSLDLPLDDLNAAIEVAFEGDPAIIDVVRISNGQTSFFANAASGGFGAQVTRALTSDDKKNWGPFAYWFSAVGQFSELTEYDVTISTERDTREHRLYGIAVSNGCYVGGGFPLAPTARLDDGLVAVSIVPVGTKLELLGAGIDLALGRRVDSPFVRSFGAESFRIQCKPQMLFSVDGEVERAIEAQYKVIPHALHCVAGPHAALVCNSA